MEFRKVTAIIRPERLKAVEDALRKLNVPGVSITRVKGFGEYANFFKSDWLCTHIRVEIITGKAHADKTVTSIMDAAHTGIEGDGIITVSPVESVYHILTREKCEKVPY